MDYINFQELVDINPSVKLSKGNVYSFIDMAAINPGNKKPLTVIQKEYSGGGAKFSTNDTIFARITPCLENGKIAKYDGENSAFGSTEFWVFRAKKNISDADFVYYLASSDIIRKPAEKSMSGASGRQRADVESIKYLPILNFPLKVQQRIAGILSAYDDLIENNTRRIKILEEMAQRIYKEWFVHFKFPGHEKAKFVNSPLGKIPEGWEVRAIEDTIEFNPKETLSKVSEKFYAAMENLSNDSMIVTFKEYRTGNSGSKYRNGDTLFARITPCLENGKTGFVQFLDETEIGIGSTEFIVLRSKTVCPEYVYLLARSEDFRNVAIKSMAGASGRQRVRLECFNEYPIVQPSKEIIVSFSNCISTFFKQIFDLDKINANLRRTRDLLLPKLINGEIEV